MTNPYLPAATRYLSNKQVTLWADWDITKPEGRDKAATWLADQIYATLNQTRDEQNTPLQHSGVVYTDPAGTHVPGFYRPRHGQQPERF